MATKSDVVVKLVLVFFISLLSFSIGTFVGKKYSDNQHKLASMEPGAHGASHTTASLVNSDGHATSGVSDEEISKIAEEFADDDTVVAKNEHGEAAHGEEAHAAVAKNEHGGDHAAPVATPVAKKEEKPEEKAPARAVASEHGDKHDETHGEEPSKAAHNVATGKEPSADMIQKTKNESRLPTALPKDVAQYSAGKFTLQIAAFNNEGEAKKRADELKTKGYSAFYIPAQVKGKTWYRVSVGLFATEKEAKDYKGEFSTKTKIDSAIIQKITN